METLKYFASEWPRDENAAILNRDSVNSVQVVPHCPEWLQMIRQILFAEWETI